MGAGGTLLSQNQKISQNSRMFQFTCMCSVIYAVKKKQSGEKALEKSPLENRVHFVKCKVYSALSPTVNKCTRTTFQSPAFHQLGNIGVNRFIDKIIKEDENKAILVVFFPLCMFNK